MFGLGDLTSFAGGPSGQGRGGPPMVKTKPCFAFQRGECTRGDSCYYIHDMSAVSSAGADGGPPAPPQVTKKPCFNFLRGQCQQGENCPYSHDAADLQKSDKVCNAFLAGNCKFGDMCRYKHELDPALSGGGAQPQKKGICNSFSRTGTCQYGDRCYYNHIAPGAPGPPAMHGMFGMMGVQGMQGQAGAPMGMAAGPFRPIFFAGHIGKPEGDQNEKDNDAEAGDDDDEEDEDDEKIEEVVEEAKDRDKEDKITEGVGGEKLVLEGETLEKETVYDLYFNKKVHFLEGFHIVPKGVIPPGLEIPFEGATTPSLDSFSLEILGRNVDTEELVTVLKVNVTGGVQWAPVEHPLNKIAVDYLVFRGTFSMISVIIHGGEVEPHLLPKKSQELVQMGIPIPVGWKDPEEDGTGFEYSSDEDNRVEDEKRKRRQGDRMTKIADPPTKIVQIMDMPVNSLHETLSTYEPQSTENLLAMFCTKRTSKLSGNCIVEVESAAVLVGKVFSLDESTLTKSAATLIQTLDDLSMCLDECLMSTISSTSFAAIDSEPEKAKFSPLKDVFDEEAINILVNYVVKALDLLRVGGEAIKFDGLSSFAQHAAAVEQVADTLLRTCESLLRNELTATVFASASGLYKLAIISAQKPRLPSKLRTHVLEAICRGVKFSSSLASFLEAPLFDLSGYQYLATSMKDTLSSETSAAAAGLEAMNWCQLFESSQRAGSCAVEVADSVAEIAKTVTWHLSAVSMSSGEEELAIAAEKIPDTAPSLAESLSKLQEVHSQAQKLVVAVEAALVSVTTSSSRETETEDLQIAIVNLLVETRLEGFLVVLAGLAGVATDLVAIQEWGVNMDTQQSVGLVLSCQSMLVRLISRILAVGGTEIFFALCPKQMQEIWSYLSRDSHLLASQSLDEINQDASLKMRLSSLGWSLKLIACVGNAVLKQGPYDLSEYFSFPAGAAVASRLGALLVAPGLLKKMQVLSKAEHASVNDYRTAEKAFRVLVHFLHCDHADTIRAMTAQIDTLHELAEHYLKLEEDADLKKVKTVALRISQATGAISARAGKSGKSGPSVAIDELLQTTSISREDLPSLDVCLSIASVSTDELRAITLSSDSSVGLAKLLVVSISAINKTCSWLRGDAGLALDASIAISGYEEDLFQGQYNSLPLATDSKGKIERLDTDTSIHRAKLLFRCLLAAVSLLDSLTKVLSTGTALNLHSPEVVSAVETANATVRQLYGVHKSGFLGLFSRRVAAACTSILGRYCCSSFAGVRGIKEENSLVSYLLTRSMESPWLMQANMELVSELLISSREAMRNLLATDCVDVEGLSVENLAQPLVASFKYEILDSDEKKFSESSGNATRALFAKFWEKQLHTQPILCDGKRFVPFSLKYDADRQLTGNHVLLKPTVTASEKRGALPWTLYGTSELLDDSCDPALSFVSSFIRRSYGVAEVLAAATMSISIEINEAACVLCVQAMTVSIESAKRVSVVLLERLQRLAFVNASLSAPFIASGLKEKERKKSAGDEADEILGRLQENSDELCRLLIFVDVLCSQPSMCPVVALVNGGLLQSLFLCLRSCRQEVVALALQVLGNAYRQLAYCSSRLTAQASVSEHNVAADCVQEVLGAIADTFVELLPDVLKRFEESEQTLVLAQTSIFAQMLRLKHQKLFLDAVSKGLTIEYFVIKLWLSLEDSFQALVEITEAFKVVDSDAIEDGEERLQAAFSSVAVSALALRCAAEMALQAYNRGWISLLTLTRCMRVSLTDPRKVSMQFQRAYTMWWTNDRLQVQRARFAAHFRESSSNTEKHRKGRETEVTTEHGGDTNSSFGHPPILQPKGSFLVEEAGLRETTAARNAMINTSLRRVVETAAKVMEYNKAGDRVERMPCNDIFSSVNTSSVDLAEPFITASAEKILAGPLSIEQTLSTLDRIGGDNAFHTALRRVIVVGSEKRSSIYDCATRYIRLRAAPLSVDPEATDRRRARRKKRKLDDISERKRRLEAAAQEKMEIESRRRSIEDQHDMIEEGSGNPQIVQLSGVPKQNVGNNFTVRPIMDYGNQ